MLVELIQEDKNMTYDIIIPIQGMCSESKTDLAKRIKSILKEEYKRVDVLCEDDDGFHDGLSENETILIRTVPTPDDYYNNIPKVIFGEV